MGHYALCPWGAGWVPGFDLVDAPGPRYSRKATGKGGDKVSALKQDGAAGKVFTFTLLVRGASPLDHLDALYEAGCDDAMFGERQGVAFAEFDRPAASLAAAIDSAIQQVESAVANLQVVRVEPDELVNAAAIAARTGRSRESIRLLIDNKRGPGGFPPAVCSLNNRTRLWHWSDVARWFAETLGEQAADVDEATLIAAVNAALELRMHGRNLRQPEARGLIARVLQRESKLIGVI